MRRWGIFLALAVVWSLPGDFVLAAPIVPGSFSTTWDTGVDTAVTINLGVCPSAVYWEEIGNDTNNGTAGSCDGSFLQTITFPSPGQYRVDFSGDFSTINLNPLGNKNKFRSVEQWGASTWDVLDFAFTEVNNLSFNAIDVPNLSETISMRYMFSSNDNFNEDISAWDVSNVTDMTSMFYYATAFNQPLNSWDVSSVTEFGSMFDNATAFNQPLDNWNVSSAQYMYSMFQAAESFNQPLNSWDVSNVILFSNMFSDTLAFNQPLADWDLSAAEDISFMFDRASQFNQDISSWNVANITDFYAMFRGAAAFNQPLNNWNVSSGTIFSDMFREASLFNQPLSSWNVSNGTDFDGMFLEATSFNQPLNDWNVGNATTFDNMFTDSGLSSANYSAVLTDWSILPSLQSAVVLDTDAQYCDTAQAARDILTTTYSWIITDGGVTTDCIVEVEDPSSSGSATRVGDRLKNKLSDTNTTSTATSTSFAQTKETVIDSIKKFVAYFKDTESQIATLPPEESKRVILLMRDIIVYLLTLLPGSEK
jgi:surface protein